MKRLMILFALAAGLALLVACGGGESGGSATTSGSAGQPQVVADDIGVGTPGQIRLVEFYADW